MTKQKAGSAVVALFVAILLPLGAVGVAEEVASREPVELQIEGVTLFTSGVAYVEYAATVEDTGSATMTLTEAGMNDLLKSLTLHDPQATQAATVRYAVDEPLSRRLARLPVDLSVTRSLPELLEQLRGERIELETPSGRRSGRLIGLERRVTEGEGAFELLVTLREDSGIGTYRFADISSVELLDEEVASGLDEALRLLDGSRNATNREITLTFPGTGRREVRVAYIREAPAWKLSYRLEVSPERSRLTGWGIIENVGIEPWEEVDLSLVSGAPRSFVLELYAPREVRRERIESPLAEADRRELLRDEAPRASRFAEVEELDAPFETQVQQTISTGEQRGEYVAYTLSEPVTLAPGEAAMVPLFGETLPGGPLLLYAAQDQVHPRHAVEIENTSGLTLQTGAVTVYEEGSYGGDAILPTLPPGERGTLVYATDLQTRVTRRTEGASDRIVDLSVEGGVMVVRRALRRTHIFEALTGDPDGRTLRILLPREPEWRLVSPETATAEGSEYTLTTTLTQGVRETLSLIEERTISQSVAFRSLGEEQIAFYLRQGGAISPELRQRLQQLAEARSELSAVRRRIETIDAEVEGIFRSQERIRSNMRVVDRESELYRTYASRLAEQEERLLELEEQRFALEGEEARALEELERLLP